MVVAHLAIGSSMAWGQAAETASGDRANLNSLGLYPPLPGVFVLEYERFVATLPGGHEFSVGFAPGFGYDIGSDDWPFETTNLYDRKVSFKTNTIAINPFARIYFGSRSSSFRTGVMLKPSLILLDPGADWRGFEPFMSYEVHFTSSVEADWFYLLFGVGFKHFLRRATLEHDGIRFSFPEFKFSGEGRGAPIMPAFNLVLGVRL